MRLLAFFRRISYTLLTYFHKFQTVILSLMVIGIVDYFFLYEILLAISPMALEAAPVILLILSIIAVRGAVKYTKKKAKEKKHYSFMSIG
ncbi:hypothetical protein [Cohnella yongneupensis]|uniref:Uncharacterized protein n=1 Tax=Cohnella yongneupensis TaxID=425006 RepID=A0ABW0QY50_9BACL